MRRNLGLLGIMCLLVMLGSANATITATLTCNSVSATCLLGFNGLPASNTALGYNGIASLPFNSVLLSNVLVSNVTNTIITSSVALTTTVTFNSPPIAQHQTYNAVLGGGNVLINNVTIVNANAPAQAKINANIIANACLNGTSSYTNNAFNFTYTAMCNVNLTKTIYPGNVFVDNLRHISVNVPLEQLHQHITLAPGGSYVNASTDFSANTFNILDILRNKTAMEAVNNATASLGCENTVVIYPNGSSPEILCSQFKNVSAPNLNDLCFSFDALHGNFTLQGAQCILAIAQLANSTNQFLNSQLGQERAMRANDVATWKLNYSQLSFVANTVIAENTGLLDQKHSDQNGALIAEGVVTIIIIIGSTVWIFRMIRPQMKQ